MRDNRTRHVFISNEPFAHAHVTLYNIQENGKHCNTVLLFFGRYYQLIEYEKIKNIYVKIDQFLDK